MSDIILEARSVSKCFDLPAKPFRPSGTLTALDCVSLELHKGETLGIAGESGCGKSTLARILMGIESPTSGEVHFRGADFRRFTREEKSTFRKTVQMVFQDPYSSLNPRMRVDEIIGEPLKIHGLTDRFSHKKRVLELMKQVGLSEEHFDRYPHQFSGGQRQRIGVARALALTPEVIIADEPLSALDISIQAQIINLFIDLQQELGLAYILISHDLAVIRHLSNRVAIMYMGRIVEQGNTKDIFVNALHPYTRALLAAIPGTVGENGSNTLPEALPMEAAVRASGCPFHPRCSFRREICLEVPPQLEEKDDMHFASCHFSGELPIDKQHT